MALVLGEVTVSEGHSQYSLTPQEKNRSNIGVLRELWELQDETWSSVGVTRTELRALKNGEELRTRGGGSRRKGSTEVKGWRWDGAGPVRGTPRAQDRLNEVGQPTE